MLAIDDPLAFLTPRQRQVAECVAQALSDRQIAARLGCSEHNVGHYIRCIADRWQLDRTRHLRVQIALVMRRAS